MASGYGLAGGTYNRSHLAYPANDTASSLPCHPQWPLNAPRNRSPIKAQFQITSYKANYKSFPQALRGVFPSGKTS